MLSVRFASVCLAVSQCSYCTVQGYNNTGISQRKAIQRLFRMQIRTNIQTSIHRWLTSDCDSEGTTAAQV